MHRLFGVVVVLSLSGLGLFAPTSATPGPTRTVAVTGTEVSMFPAFDPATTRYGVTTTDATGGSLQVTASTTDPAGQVLIDGRPTPSGSARTVSGLSEGDEVSVIFLESGGSTAYSLVYLPTQFPAMDATGAGPVQPGYLGVGLTTFGAGPSFEALLDRNGVPAWVRTGASNDLKRQTNGELTVMRPTTAGADGFTGYDLLTLDNQFAEVARRHVATPLTDTDNHDSQRLADGSTILIGYEPRGPVGTGYLDATIQKLDVNGNVVFQWSSEGLEAETLNAMPWPQGSPDARIDYAHVNSVEEIPDGTHDLLVSFRHFSSVYRIATVAHDTYASGDVVWRLGGRHSDFTFVNDNDFPTPGPCAQHNATWIGPDRVLLFDNGSVTLGLSHAACVDPSDPVNGVGIARAHTRVSEYVLDPVNGTATLDWSYVPTGKFTFFAGATARLGNGHTLVGWASDRTTLATEVDAAASPVWSLAVRGNTQNVGYTSYRVSLLDYTDAIAPTITPGVTDKAVYVVGDSVAPPYRCTDEGGSTLQSCTVTGLTAGRLDTTTVGTRAWTVTAEDGAGNPASVTQTYTVRSGRMPDGMIRKGGSTWWKGSNVYGPATDQTVGQHAHRRHTVRSFWRVQNDGERADAFTLVGTRGNARYKVRYFAGSADVTAAVVAGTYRTATIAAGASVTLRVEVTPTRRARVGRARTFTLRAASTTTPDAVDRVATRVTARR
jgi:hypothetical protein